MDKGAKASLKWSLHWGTLKPLPEGGGHGWGLELSSGPV